MEVSQRGFRESIKKPRVHKEAWLERKKERKMKLFLVSQESGQDPGAQVVAPVHGCLRDRSSGRKV